MKLQNVITFRLSVLKAVSIALWAVLFYFAIIKEINNATDKGLAAYAETVMTGYLSGDSLPQQGVSSAMQYRMRDVSMAYASRHSHIRYRDTEEAFDGKRREEPARTITYIFKTADGQYKELSVSTPTIDKDDLKRAILYWLVALYAVLMAGVVVVNLWTVRHSMKPLRRLLAWLDAYKLGQAAKPLDNDTDITEFKIMNETVRRSVERNERLYEQQRLFIANASHEMQTPLAVCANRLEMLLDDGKLEEGQMAEIIKTLHALEGLARTNRSLLLLCKIGNRQFDRREPVSFKAVATGLLPGLEAVYGYKRISVRVDLTVAPVALMDGDLAQVLLSNLLKNAFVHNVQGGEVCVSADGNSFTVANTGGAQPLDGNKIFERFYHSPANKQSTGLGLSLVKAVCDLYGFGIDYLFAGGKHVFRLTVCKKELNR